ncbi:hypothetical protein ANN_13150 [Periplaneta americana]|uniref:Reverse transcriptase domain-containing protein n=1 Tax=Periplaneta americana TaxID=6978 RepID=A0ABQ8TIL2_PERAM|nr:hypothetical protein ANN_13150 [Periplaneta americana]
MIMSRDQNIVRNGNIKIGNLSCEKVEKFKYLGATVTNINDTRQEIKRRINMENARHYSVEKLLSSSLLSKNLQIRILTHCATVPRNVLGLGERCPDTEQGTLCGINKLHSFMPTGPQDSMSHMRMDIRPFAYTRTSHILSMLIYEVRLLSVIKVKSRASMSAQSSIFTIMTRQAKQTEEIDKPDKIDSGRNILGTICRETNFYSWDELSRRLKNFLPFSMTKMLLQTLVMPHFDYCDILLTDLSVTSAQKLQRVHNMCVRFVCNIRRTDHIHQMHTGYIRNHYHNRLLNATLATMMTMREGFQFCTAQQRSLHGKTQSSESLLDLIIIKNADKVQKHGQCAASGISYHDIIYLVYSLKCPKPTPKLIRTTQAIRNAKLRHFHNILKVGADPSKLWRNLRTIGLGNPRTQVDSVPVPLDELNDHFATIQSIALHTVDNSRQLTNYKLLQFRIEKYFTSLMSQKLNKAFDTVDTNLLLCKLRRLNLSESSVTWFESYLCKRQQCVIACDYSSKWCVVKSRIQQGSVLGPLRPSHTNAKYSQAWRRRIFRVYSGNEIRKLPHTDAKYSQR